VTSDPTRRAVLAGLGAAWVLPSSRAWADSLDDRIAALEAREGGRLGVCAIDGDPIRLGGHRDDERFAMCSTVKLVIAGWVLSRVDAGAESLGRKIRLQRRHLVMHSPVCEPRVGERMTIAELCHAMVTTSDNCATNLLLGRDGPQQIRAFTWGLGDPITRLDRLEPEMNLVDLAHGDERDTTTPAAMAYLMRSLALGDALSPASREIFVGWLRGAVTGTTRLRASWPAEWRPGDKTGTGPDGPTNDVAIAWPPGQTPIIVSAYYDRAGRTMEENAAVLAEVGRMIADGR
jgi:beta-lactamase class A